MALFGLDVPSRDLNAVGLERAVQTHLTVVHIQQSLHLRQVLHTACRPPHVFGQNGKHTSYLRQYGQLYAASPVVRLADPVAVGLVGHAKKCVGVSGAVA